MLPVYGTARRAAARGGRGGRGERHVEHAPGAGPESLEFPAGGDQPDLADARVQAGCAAGQRGVPERLGREQVTYGERGSHHTSSAGASP